MSRFGLSGYQCEITKTEDGAHLVAWLGNDHEVSVEQDVKNEDIPYKEYGIESRENTERLFAPLFEELEGKRAENNAKAEKAKAEAAKKSSDANVAYRKKNRENPASEVAKDGTRGSNPVPLMP